MEINWLKEVEKRKDTLIADIQAFLQMKSVWEEETAREGAPFGEGIAAALEHLLEKGKRDGFAAKNLEGYAAHLEMGQGDDLIGVLCHIDVVPEGDGWSSDPYGAEIREGKIYARGAIDDKGPTMAAYYAMKIVKELGLPLSKRVRMIIGTDEESQWRCVDHYFAHEEMPGMGFAPDADFPIINAEKGICDLYLVQTGAGVAGGSAVLKEFSSGRRLNMVPDYAKAVVETAQAASLAEAYGQYVQQHGRNGHATAEGNTLTLEMEGISAHGSTPEKGINAGLQLAQFLTGADLADQGAAFVQFAAQKLAADTRGDALGIQYEDEITGPLTVNIGRMSYDEEAGGTFGLNIRYPVTTDLEATLQSLAQHAEGFAIQNMSDSKPHHVDKNHVLIQTLQRVYTEQTGEEAALLAIGGGTYARSLKAGVAFGPLFPGKEELAHQKDEYIEIADVVKATAIYAQAIYELAK
ncbi:dipeptidase PepV [Ectobacillus ponti]|uniref:Dipeptidase PepV n=1 Tax=Ectobacillus ponti TaxID=2961894 RepID=A0AA41X8T4_9BACI|nr:dipeptidase PepV [Ectobacillus ponti]MCP8967501.1 dipeptidase PepV [Ectobacillus ponti]